ncbi:hypothetical protein GCM10022223_52210 [Kineosporia mesophila]|uniref:Nudix hydrolase domain-containing protein n=1 Tax=Kineosporia mesophila TaxID=566012 RepID=A0ABP7AAM8_9ACTN|nr:NUDIX hydrolase [Kineosporia mesophila]MCD5351389.1 NUDIX hydrolase [Kineosporia mesophila]
MSATGPTAIEFLEGEGPIRFVETPGPSLTSGHRTAMDGLWREAVQANPALFDGPVVAVTGLSVGSEGIEVSWARTTYRRHVLEQVPGAVRMESLYVSVAQPTPVGVLLGRMAAWTSGPGRWVLPGGSVEPPEPGKPLDESLLRDHAARELREETGLEVDPSRLERWAVLRNPIGNLGIFYRAAPMSEAMVRDRFTAHNAQQRLHGEEPELTDIHFVGGPADLDDLEGPAATSVPALLERFRVVTEGC